MGASQWQAEAFRSAVLSDVLRWWCTEREAIDAIRASGARREPVAEYADGQLDLADRLTGAGEELPRTLANCLVPLRRPDVSAPAHQIRAAPREPSGRD